MSGRNHYGLGIFAISLDLIEEPHRRQGRYVISFLVFFDIRVTSVNLGIDGFGFCSSEGSEQDGGLVVVMSRGLGIAICDEG